MTAPSRKSYPTDLTDARWDILKPLLTVKNGKGRNHILVDVLGFAIAVLLTAANVDDGVAAIQLLEQVTEERCPRLALIWGDGKYHNLGLLSWLKSNRPSWTIVQSYANTLHNNSPKRSGAK